MTTGFNPDSHLPLKAVDFHILLALSEEEQHGYGMVKAIETQSEGRVRLEPGNLYRYIRRLEAEGLIESVEPRDAAEAKPNPSDRSDRRRYYAATRGGRQVLAAEAARMRALAAAAEGLPGVATGRST